MVGSVMTPPRYMARTIAWLAKDATGATRQPLRYIGVGLVSTAINYAIFTGGIYVGLHYLVAATVSTAVTVMAGFFLHRTFTFSARKAATLREFLSFLSVIAVQYVLGMTGYWLLIGKLQMSPSLAFVLNNIVLASITYCLFRYRTFRVHRG